MLDPPRGLGSCGPWSQLPRRDYIASPRSRRPLPKGYLLSKELDQGSCGGASGHSCSLVCHALLGIYSHPGVERL